jgi:hypothetical protein
MHECGSAAAPAAADEEITRSAEPKPRVTRKRKQPATVPPETAEIAEQPLPNGIVDAWPTVPVLGRTRRTRRARTST